MNQLIVALGNPGPKYELNRHNIGWLAVDQLKILKDAIWKEKFKGVYCEISYNGAKVYFLKPYTYMNLSGESVQALIQFFKIDIPNILVIHDELDLPWGEINYKTGGGLAGHNGLKSIAQCTGSQDFLRLRIGIGRPQHGSVSNWVLSDFPVSANVELERVLNFTEESIEYYLKNGMQKTANKYNKKNIFN
jgi:PTH1 family peptidyl-tRNA hydrolase